MADASTDRKDLPDTKNEGVNENLDQLTDNKVRYPDPEDRNNTLEREPETAPEDAVAPTYPEPSGTDGPGNDSADQPSQEKSAE